MKRFLKALSSEELSPEPWVRRAIETELDALRGRAGALPELGALEPGDLLEQVRARKACSDERVRSFFSRVEWLLAPPDPEALQGLDPVRDADRIFHFVAREFQSELKIFAVLHEMRAAVSLPLSTFFLQTGEFKRRGVKRIVDTVLLVCNVLEWGPDSVRGRACLERINQIHSRYAIPNAAFKFVLSGIMFIPWEFCQRFGFRPLSDVERLGWFHAFEALGRRMGIGELDGDFDTSYAWYREVSQASARFAPNKLELVRDILGQVLARYPVEVRGVIAAAFVAGMDDAYLTATSLPRVPARLENALGRLFAAAHEWRGARGNGGPWLQSLLPSSVYPAGYELDQLGSPERASPPFRLPREAVIDRDELSRRVARGELLVILSGHVYDLTSLAEHHPGGRSILERHAGQDATRAFAAAPHSAATHWFRDNYRIGRWLDEDGQRSDTMRPLVSSEEFLGPRRTRTVPLPEQAASLEDLAAGLLPLVNGRAAEPLSREQLLAQLEALVG